VSQTDPENAANIGKLCDHENQLFTLSGTVIQKIKIILSKYSYRSLVATGAY
jgi:hypothetical protein